MFADFFPDLQQQLDKLSIYKPMHMNRDQLQEAYIQWDLNQMSVEDLKQYFINMQNAELDSLDDDELVEEVEQYAPELV